VSARNWTLYPSPQTLGGALEHFLHDEVRSAPRERLAAADDRKNQRRALLDLSEKRARKGALSFDC
jgi:hypothetical protein